MYSIDVLDKCFNCIILCFITPTQIAMYLIYFHSFCAHTFTHTHTHTHTHTQTHIYKHIHTCISGLPMAVQNHTTMWIFRLNIPNSEKCFCIHYISKQEKARVLFEVLMHNTHTEMFH